MHEPTAPLTDSLATPVAWANAEGQLLGGNPAFASWLGISLRRVPGLTLQELDAEGGRLEALLPRLPLSGGALRVRRARMASPGGGERFADLWLARSEDGGLWLEVHPADEFPGEDSATALPAALSAALKGLAHEVRNPLAGMKGAAQLLARRVEGEEATELVQLIS
ncbi:MAG TPA: histidine kinase dimerization/phospho-acceptor domain-containing protein, partial [Arenimonas sp.]